MPNTATNMYSYLLARCIMLLAGLSLLRRKKALRKLTNSPSRP
ncbi:LPXTG cell wall anchor domain-containing protein [Paenibacillus sp. 2KB_20]